MKYLYPLLSVLTVFLMTLSCQSDEILTDSSPVKVTNLISPSNSLTVNVNESDRLSFEWQATEWEGEGKPYFELMFDKAGGDFSAPVHSITTDRCTAELGKEEILRIYDALSDDDGKADVIWTVYACSGKDRIRSSTRLLVFVGSTDEGEDDDEDEDVLMMAGPGSEQGQKFSYILNSEYYSVDKPAYSDLAGPLDGWYYEIYTQLTAGQPYWFEFGDGRKLSESTYTVQETGIYRIRIDAAGGEVMRARVNEVSLYVSHPGSMNRMTYAGNGTWTIKDYNIRWVKASWGIEERYRFVADIDGVKQGLGACYPGLITGRPGKDADPKYFYIMPTVTDQYKGVYKFPDWLIDPEVQNRYFADVYLYMNADKAHYTHEFLNGHELDAGDFAYTNPLFVDFSLPDPDVIRGEDGYFYSYTTEHNRTQCRNVPIMRSSDLVNWQKVGTVFTDKTHPWITQASEPASQEDKKAVWAPAVHKVGDKYVCYYSQPGEKYKHAIGVAVADRPEGPFTDHGKLIDSNEQGVDISIDAFLYQEDGRNWLFWGSFRKISVLELTEDGLAIKDKSNQKRVEVAGGQYEASVVLKRNGYYYLMVSTGDYSKGGTYRIVVGRSANLLGPYVDRQGRDMMKVNHELVLEGNANFSSPGHCSKIITDDNGQDWILYHAYVPDKNYRVMMLDKIDWTEDGWPVAPYQQASAGGAVLPYFN